MTPPSPGAQRILDGMLKEQFRHVAEAAEWRKLHDGTHWACRLQCPGCGMHFEALATPGLEGFAEPQTLLREEIGYIWGSHMTRRHPELLR